MKRLITTLLISMLSVIAVSGCQEENSSAAKRQARLMGNQNLKLETIIKDKDAEIANLQTEMLECEKKNAALQNKKSIDTMGAMEMMMSANKQDSNLKIQNEILKAKIKELEKLISN